MDDDREAPPDLAEGGPPLRRRQRELDGEPLGEPRIAGQVGDLSERDRGGLALRETLDQIEVALTKVRDATAGELTAEVNRSRRRTDRVHVSSIKRALTRHGYVVKKAPTAAGESASRRRHQAGGVPETVCRVPIERLVFLDESGMNVSMSRSHAWVKRGEEFIDRIPMNWGKNLTRFSARSD